MEKDFNYTRLNENRKSGVILHISSLASNYGIGTFGKASYDFVDFLSKAGFHYWQILPLGPTSYGDSPYQSPSTFAGNPYFIDLDILCDEGLLEKSDYENIDFGQNPLRVDYGKLYQNRYVVLRKAYEKFDTNLKEFKSFIIEKKSWLEDYALFMVIKNKNNGLAWDNWEEKEKNKDEALMQKYKKEFEYEINFIYFMQFKFFEQYKKLKEYTNSKNIKIVGDIPIYCSFDSSDVWVDRKNFSMDLVGGCPPDDFSSEGQLWGNPCYDYEYMKKDNFSWWINRLKGVYSLYDVIRIDHFRGFESYWAIPKTSTTARDGKWLLGTGYELFDAIKEKLGDIDVIAEDLGYTTKEVVDFREYTGFPGMKMMQFAWDPSGNSDSIPHEHIRNCAVYPSTHDSDTILGWIKSNEGTKHFEFCKKYLNLTKEEGYLQGFLRGAWSSVANIAITQMQDFLKLDNDYRMNIPSTLGNWSYRMSKDDLTDELAKEIREFNRVYKRLNIDIKEK
ncbi:4-alpha-glucanotransferase [Oceanivirga miroungae]|uniref:4-alpha-glucanotransferase n=1 Tax=Oceanivirga miroungae TaxID=1130046 RepID=A0A6I8MC09_9FUSO|nr:4-alpha-glucanotransferase [Oceanivirga miroungae]